ncbi:MAG: signal peptidase II [Chloroflexia bacterium]
MEVQTPPLDLDGTPVTSAARLRSLAPLLAVAALVLLADQVSKAMIIAAIGRAAPTHSSVVLPGLLVFQYSENTGTAFGMFHNAGWLLGVFALAVVVGIVVMLPRLQQGTGSGRAQLVLTLGLVLGGALGNLLDRVAHGFVVDFILVPAAHLTLGNTGYQWPNFNIADSAITIGMVLLVVRLFLEER